MNHPVYQFAGAATAPPFWRIASSWPSDRTSSRPRSDCEECWATSPLRRLASSKSTFLNSRGAIHKIIMFVENCTIGFNFEFFYSVTLTCDLKAIFKAVFKKKNSLVKCYLVCRAGGRRGRHPLRLQERPAAGIRARLPDGDSRISMWYVFGPSGLKDYGSATLRCKI